MRTAVVAVAALLLLALVVWSVGSLVLGIRDDHPCDLQPPAADCPLPSETEPHKRLRWEVSA